MHISIRHALIFLWDFITTGHWRSGADKPAQEIVYSKPAPDEAENQESFSQDASPPGAKIRWWT